MKTAQQRSHCLFAAESLLEHIVSTIRGLGYRQTVSFSLPSFLSLHFTVHNFSNSWYSIISYSGSGVVFSQNKLKGISHLKSFQEASLR